MFNIGMPELILILVVALIVLGPKRLPEMAKSLGKALREFQKATEDLKDSLQKDLHPDEPPGPSHEPKVLGAPPAAPGSSEAPSAGTAPASETPSVKDEPAHGG
jgi:Tat protein translocase TatB subunit